MGKWTDPQEWARLLTPEGCPICTSGGPTNVIAEFGASWVVMSEEAPLPGSCALFLKRHAIELHDLTPAEATAYMSDIQRLSRALKAATGAVKMNYEIHGNTIPHLHAHFFPRFVGDPFEGQPINPRAAIRPAYNAGRYEAIRQRLRATLHGENAPRRR